jgi:hypothetical protein
MKISVLLLARCQDQWLQYVLSARARLISGLKVNGFGMAVVIRGATVTGHFPIMDTVGGPVHGKKEIADGIGIAGIGKDKSCFL